MIATDGKQTIANRPVKATPASKLGKLGREIADVYDAIEERDYNDEALAPLSFALDKLDEAISALQR